MANQSRKESISNSISGWISSVSRGFQTGMQGKPAANNGGSLLHFPEVLNSKQYDQRPIVFFEQQEGQGSRGGDSCFLPAPIGFSVSDNANFGDTELGILATITLAGAQELKAGGGFGDSAGAAVGMAAYKAKQAAGNPTETLGGILSKKGGEYGKALGIGIQSTENPNIHTHFDGNSTRSFGFAYKLVPSSKEEAGAIKNINAMFRMATYGESLKTVLRYPPKWKISFHTGSPNKGQLDSLPKIAECYLTSFTSVYNSSANAWFEDGSPVECDITMQFKETRALTYQDIKELV